MMKLITELVEDVRAVVTESKDGKGKQLRIEGTFLQAGIKNKNGRIYPPEIMEREVARYVKDRIDIGAAYGELGHPQGPTINPDRISHRITELKRNGNDWAGKAVIINEGMGKIVRGIIESGGRLGVSSRALGSLKEGDDGVMIVQEDLHLSTAADIVTDPSAPSAWVNGIMEGADWVYDAASDAWRKQEAIEDLRREMKSMTASQIDEGQLELLRRFLKTL